MLFNRSERLLWFTTQFHLLYETGIGFATSLTILEQTSVDAELKRVINDLSRIISQGKALSEGLAKHPVIFPSFYIEMIKVGEHTGKLAETLQELHLFYLRKSQFQQELVRSLSYPCIIMGLMFLLTGGLCFIVVPRFAAIFASFHAPLPMVTQLLFDSVSFVTAHIIVLLAIFSFTIVAGWRSFKVHATRLNQHPYLLHLPLLGPFYHKILLLQLCRVLGLSLKAGLSMQDSVRLSQRMFQKTPLMLAIPLILYDLKQGRRLSEIFSRSQYFPEVFQGFMRIAEETGTLDKQFLALADIFTAQVEKSLARCKIYLEPCMMLVTGLIIGGVSLAIYYPIFSLGSAI